jgi:transposase InsO family protein
LLSKHDRLLRLEKTHREQTIELNDEQIRLLERFSPEFRERQIEVHYTGELVAVDTFFVGALKGVGKVYLQTVLDCYSRHAWGRRYTSKLPVTSVHVLNEMKGYVPITCCMGCPSASCKHALIFTPLP